MSGVATLKVRGAKRHFDEMAVDLPVASQACSPSRYPLRPPPLKRGRCTPSAITTPLRNVKHLNSNNNTHNSNNISSSSLANASSGVSSPASTPMQKEKPSGGIASSSSTSPPSAPTVGNSVRAGNSSNTNSFQPCAVSTEELAFLARHLPRKLRRVVERLAAGQVSSSELLFSLGDLREVVNSVLAERDVVLADQFNATLNERLAEQFRDFTKFNEDYVSRQLRGTDVAYLS